MLMDIKFINQPKELKMGDILRKKLEERFDDAWIISGIVKDSGIEYLIESIEKGISNGTKVHMLIGVDRKNTSKDILLKLLSVGVDLNIHVKQEFMFLNQILMTLMFICAVANFLKAVCWKIFA